MAHSDFDDERVRKNKRKSGPHERAGSHSDEYTTSSSGSDSEHERTKKHKRVSSRHSEKSRDRDRGRDRERQRRREKNQRHKEKRHRQKQEKKSKDSGGPVQLSKFLGRDKEDGVRRSAISGKKIHLKVEKSKEDKLAESSRNELLKFLNASYD